MDFIVLELQPNIRIATKDGDPIVFKAKNDAFRYADTKCNKGLVYPLTDVMKILDEIKELSNKYSPTHPDDANFLEELYHLTNDIV